MASYEEILESCTDRMQSSLNNFSDNLKKIRTGRANPAMLDGIMVDYYGNMTPLNQVASISTPNAQTISIQPWEKDLLEEIEKKEALEKYGSEGSGKNLPFSSLSEDLKKKEEEKE